MYYRFILLILFLCSFGCEQEEVKPISYYDCSDSNDRNHPKAETFQSILDENLKLDVVGGVLLVKDSDGLWIGSGGYADLASNVSMKTCNTFYIASISKLYTAVLTYKYIDRGLLSFDDQISQYLPSEIIEEVANVSTSSISDLLSHRSGIPDFYTDQFDLDRLNTELDLDKFEVLEYVYGKSADFSSPDESYSYSNTNYLLYQ